MYLIRCPRCLQQNDLRVLGGIISNGIIGIQRKRKKEDYEEMTIVRGADFELICGYCRTIVYKQIPSVMPKANGLIWSHWMRFVNGSIIQGEQGTARLLI